ncbi:polycystin-1-like protein 2 [Montipora foliosa]|uniref:polycystin-1-like protein 2 n=1 Tax=Montipora foliosa TaxID=591990 RepID=UPI0035F16295
MGTRPDEVERQSRSNRCAANCQHKVSTRRKLLFRKQCAGISCSFLTSYHWSLYIAVNNGSNQFWRKVDHLSEIALTSLDGPNLAIRGYKRAEMNHSALTGNRTYKIVLVARLDKENYLVDSLVFHTNLSPSKKGKDSGCTVDPKQGEAVLTEFAIKCFNWTDMDRPLRYQFSYQTKFGVVVFHTGLQSNLTTDLPPGSQTNNYSLVVQLEVIDSLGDSSVELVNVQVTPPKSAEITADSQNKLDDLFASGNSEKAMQLAFAMLSMADSQSGSLKDSLLGKMANVEVASMQQATLVVGVIAMATDNEDGISDDSQEKALGMLENAADFIASEMASGSVDSDLVQSIGTSLFSGIGNVLNAASSKAGSETEEKTNDENEVGKGDEDKGKEKVSMESQHAVNLVSKVGDSLLGTKEVGEKPTVFKTKSLDVLLDRQRSSDMGGKKLGDGPSGVALPSGSSLFAGQGDGPPEDVDSQMLSFNKNPFTWDKSAETVKSSVIDFKLKASGGKAMNISGLQEPIELFIPITPKTNEPQKSNDSEPHLFLKPSDGTSNIRFHRFSVSSPEVLVSITIKPEHGKTVDVFVNYKTKPTPQSHVFSTTIPNWSQNCSSNPYTFTFSSLVSNKTGFHFLGIQYMRKSTESDRTRRSCNPSGQRRGKRSCVDVKDAPTTPAPTPIIVVPKYNMSTDLNYTLSISVSGCLYWSESKEKWTGEGCQVGPKTTSKQLQCLCTHLSAFGGDFFVAPNPIDFDKVFAAFGNLAESGNFAVLSTVCVILGLYLIALVFARREDKQDELRVVANVNLNENEGENKYHISIQSGMWRGNGTSANVGLAIYGSEGSTGDISLTDPQLEKLFFARGSINNFTLCVQESLGSVERIRIWHDNSGRSPSWFLMQVLIVDLASEEKTHFVANRWIAVEKEDGKLELDLQAAGKKQLSEFRNLFYSRTATNLGEKHLWLSVFTRPPHNPFTRAQRLACCVSILFAAMITNAMFYNFGTPPGDAMQIGPLKVSLTQIKIGIQSSIVAIPVNVLVVSIFRNVKPSETGDEETKPKRCLPHWFLFVAWFICTMATLTSATFILFYSLMWGAETSNEWLVSVMVSFFQDVIVMQPIKVLIVASILSVLIKKPPEQEKVIGDSVSGCQGGDVVPPNEIEREKARKFRSSLVQIGRKVLEFVLFGIFILLMMVVCYSNRGFERFMVTQSMEDMFQSFARVHNIPTFWKWSKNTFLPRVYDVGWYNGRPFQYEEGFLSNRVAFLVGMPRMRQLRVKPEWNCPIMASEPKLARLFPRCLPFYITEVENVSPYNRPRWVPVQNATIFYNDFELEKECPRPWRYRTAEDLNLRPFGGVMAVFVGGGYIADLGYNARSARRVIEVLEDDEWIDNQTVAVFVEFTIFEPSSSLFSAVKLLFERTPTGGSLATVAIKTLSLYASPDPSSRSLFQICQLVLMIMIIVFIFAEIGKLRREKCSYFKELWNWLELLQISSTICALVFFFLKESKTSQFVKKLQENPFKTTSIDYIEFMSDLETYLLSFVLFIITIKFLRLIKFNRHVCQVIGTLQRAATKVLSFMMVFVIIVLAYTQVGFLVFSTDVNAYSSFYSSLRALLLLLFGGAMHFEELQSTSRYITPIFLFSYLLTMFMVLLNMFLAILNDCYNEVKNVDPGEAFADAELGAFLVDYSKQKVKDYRDEAWTLVKSIIDSFERLLRKDKPRKTEDDFESLSEQAKLASCDSMNDIDSEDDCGDKRTDALFKFKSLSNADKFESVSLNDLKESIVQIGREIRQSLTSLKSPSSRKSSYHTPTPYDFKRALERLEEDDGSFTLDQHSSYFSAFGSYLEDIWQKDPRKFRDGTQKSRHKSGEMRDRNVCENKQLLEER